MKSVKSRYSIATISQNHYGTLSVSGNTNNNVILENKSGSLEQGYVFVPYIMATTIPIIVESREEKIHRLREERINKLNELFIKNNNYMWK